MDSRSESEMIAALAEIFASSRSEIQVGIGDDAAVLADPKSRLVICADMAVEGVHFKREWSSLEDIGAKITAANLADIYAMGATPQHLLVTASLPRTIGKSELQTIALGIKAEGDKASAVVVGGDLSSGESLTISITAIGTLSDQRSAITRAGAKVGDRVIISSLPGRSAAGLAALLKNSRPGFDSYIAHHCRPSVDYEIARKFAEAGVSSMIDTSDGLLSEAKHIATSSNVSLEIQAPLIEKLPNFIQLSDAARNLGEDVWDWILSGGEDHAFLATTSGEIPDGALVIGHVRAGEGVSVQGVPVRRTSGFTHFRN